jgi:hypothetical protein
MPRSTVGGAATRAALAGRRVVALGVGGLAAPPLKSVAYQPLPLSWKPGAVSCLEKFSVLHSGQVVSSGSLTFRMTSFSKPQSVQR